MQYVTIAFDLISAILRSLSFRIYLQFKLFIGVVPEVSDAISQVSVDPIFVVFVEQNT